MDDSDNIGIAYFDRTGRQLHSIDGWHGGLEAAEEHAQDMLNRAIYDRATEARVYRGRTYKAGEVLKVVTHRRRWLL